MKFSNSLGRIYVIQNKKKTFKGYVVKAQGQPFNKRIGCERPYSHSHQRTVSRAIPGLIVPRGRLVVICFGPVQ